MTWRTNLLPPAAWAEALCDLLPTLRSAAHGLEPRRELAETLLFDAILESLVVRSDAARATRDGRDMPSAARMFSLMRTARLMQSRVGDRCAMRGAIPCPVDAGRRLQAAAILALPPAEREAVVLLTLLRAAPARAAELAGATPAAMLVRREIGEASLAANAAAAPATLTARAG